MPCKTPPRPSAQLLLFLLGLAISGACSTKRRLPAVEASWPVERGALLHDNGTTGGPLARKGRGSHSGLRFTGKRYMQGFI